jgi:hypothetical protein
MKKIAVLLLAVLTMSCSVQETVEPQNLSNVVSPSVSSVFVGQYFTYETLINGELLDTCDTLWTFDGNTVLIERVLPCPDGPASSGVRQFTFDNDFLYITMGGNTEAYPYTNQGNGFITVQHVSGDFTITYKLAEQV